MSLKITRVEALEGQPDLIFVEFDTGTTVLLALESKLDEPLFAQIRELSNPRTDGERVYWINGASLTVPQIIAMVEASNDGCG